MAAVKNERAKIDEAKKMRFTVVILLHPFNVLLVEYKKPPGERMAFMVRFEGEKDFPQSPAEVWEKLSDARFLVQCIPDVESVADVQPDRAKMVLRPGFSFVRGTLEATLQIVDTVPPTAARYTIANKGIGSSADVEATIALAPQGTGTRVQWTAEVKTLGGLLKMVPSGLIRGAAQKVVHDTWNAVEAKLSAG
jgi:carbon monoxide dehydrogenase subunit G